MRKRVDLAEMREVKTRKQDGEQVRWIGTTNKIRTVQGKVQGNERSSLGQVKRQFIIINDDNSQGV